MKGVHLDEPSTPQPWEEDLDLFIRQLTDPKSFQNVKLPHLSMHHQRMRPVQVATSSSTTLPSSQSEQALSSRVTEKRLSSDMDKKCSLLHSASTSSNCECPQSKGSWQCAKSLHHTYTSDGRGVLQRDDAVEVSCSSCYEEDLGIDNDSPPISPKDKVRVTFTCDSSPEISDEDNHAHTHTTENKNSSRKAKESKKSRFRKMITRPLRRSCSAGNPKDVPAYALFLQFNPGSLPEKSTLADGPPTQKAYSEPHVAEACDADCQQQQHKPVRKVMSDDPSSLITSETSSSQAPVTKSNSRSKLARHVKRKLQFLRRRHTDSALGESTAKLQEGKMNIPSREDAVRWSRSFENLLTDKHGLQLFRQFLRSEFSEENIEFWIACEDYQHTRTNRLPAKAQTIYSDYVAVHAPKEINLDSKTRINTISNMTNLNRKTFQDAQKRIQALMERDSYPRFLQSGYYQNILSNHRK
ncbi:uncharacterized protein LOC135480314 isoform X2 [Liolophura sinensis]|uniref:uncharacterized protein LOC135480314 isoform X2 n=1 Tax=Liolophura sinensis TaxID=3198878 RepID=UPI00315948E0